MARRNGSAPSRPDTTALKDTARDVFDRLWNDREFDVLEQHLHPDVVLTVAITDRAPLRGRASVAAFVRELLAGIPDLRRETFAVFGEGEQVLVRAEMFGTQRGELLGVPATVLPVRLTEMLLIRFDGGQIVEINQQADYLGLLTQLGLTPPEGVGPLGSVLHTFKTVGRLGGLVLKGKLSARKEAVR